MFNSTGWFDHKLSTVFNSTGWFDHKLSTVFNSTGWLDHRLSTVSLCIGIISSLAGTLRLHTIFVVVLRVPRQGLFSAIVIVMT